MLIRDSLILLFSVTGEILLRIAFVPIGFFRLLCWFAWLGVFAAAVKPLCQIPYLWYKLFYFTCYFFLCISWLFPVWKWCTDNNPLMLNTEENIYNRMFFLLLITPVKTCQFPDIQSNFIDAGWLLLKNSWPIINSRIYYFFHLIFHSFGNRRKKAFMFVRGHKSLFLLTSHPSKKLLIKFQT